MFYLITNDAEHSGHYVEANPDEKWASDNPDGWTYQSLGGSHDTCVAEFETEQEAADALAAYLADCPASRGESDCYTHGERCTA